MPVSRITVFIYFCFVFIFYFLFIFLLIRMWIIKEKTHLINNTLFRRRCHIYQYRHNHHTIIIIIIMISGGSKLI